MLSYALRGWQSTISQATDGLMSANDNEAVKQSVLKAAQQLLEPLASLLMETGHGVGDLHAVAKRAFIGAALANDDATRKPNVSRIAAVTGLTRVEVTRILHDQAGVPEPATGTHRAERVLQGWWTDPHFTDKAGEPRRLPLLGTQRSFAALAKEYGGDINHAAVLKALLHVKAVRQLADGSVEALRRHVGEVRWSPQGLETLSTRLRAHFATLLHNLRHPSRPHYERVVESTRLNPLYAARLIRDLTSQMEVIANSMDHELNDTEVVQKPGTRDAMHLGVGFYLFESENIDGTDSAPPIAPTSQRRSKSRLKR